jgi:membrane-associated phospholipid phosphatase
LVMVRSFFITLTHLKIPADAIIVEFPKIYDFVAFNNDLFFSGHTAIAFLGFLLFIKQKTLRIFFLISTVVMAITVLFMHVHYSIDVFASLFITYGSYKIGEMFFKEID